MITRQDLIELIAYQLDPRRHAEIFSVDVDEDGTICVVQPDGPAFGVVVVGLQVPA